MSGNQKIWSVDWLNSIGANPERINFFSLQFANYRRIEHNDAVYIFDEVGCGKTISAGVIARHYLHNNLGKNVLVIATPALAGDPQKNAPALFWRTGATGYPLAIYASVFL